MMMPAATDVDVVNNDANRRKRIDAFPVDEMPPKDALRQAQEAR